MPGGGTANAALLFLLVTSSLLPILYEYYRQHQTKKKRSRIIEELIISVAEVALQVRRQLHTATADDQEQEQGGRRKRQRVSRFKHERAEQAVYEDYFAPIPVFDDRQFGRIYRVLTKSIVQLVFDTCA